MTITAADVTLRKGPWYIGYAPVGKVATLVYDFDNDRYFRNQTITSINGVLTTTRKGQATYYDSTGEIQYVTSHVPRINHDPTTGSCLGLMVEDSSSNYFLHTESFNNADWTKQNSCTVTANATIAPDGDSTGDLIEWGANGSSVYQIVTTLGTTSDVAVSVYAKPSSGDGLSILVYNWTTFATIKALIVNDITTGESVANGFYRHEVIANTADGSGFTAGDDINIYIYPDNNYGYVTNSALYLWGAQFEQRSSVTSYIPNGGGTGKADRHAEVFEHTLDSEYAGGGTFFVEFDSAPQSSTIMEFYASSTNTLKIQSGIITFTGNGSSSTGTYGNTTLNRVSMRFGENGTWDYTYNGSQPTSKSGTAMTASPATLRVGSTQTNSNRLNGHIRKIMYYPRQANDNRLTRLTNGA